MAKLISGGEAIARAWILEIMGEHSHCAMLYLKEELV